MSSSAVDQASLIACPFAAASPTTRRGVYRVATGAAVSVAWPSILEGCFVRLKARGAACQVGFSEGSAGVTLVANQLSAIGTGSAAAGYTIEVGEYIDVLVPRSATFLNYVAESGTGTLEIYVSELPGV